MEITKQSENFTLTDVTDSFKVIGNVNLEVSGNLHVNFSINSYNEEYLADCSYCRFVDKGDVNFNITCKEQNRDEFTEYANTLIESIFNHFKLYN